MPKAPGVLAPTETLTLSTTAPFGPVVVIKTRVPDPGAGETVPLTSMDWVPVYEAASVWTVIVYVVAPRAASGNTATARRKRKETEMAMRFKRIGS